MTDEQKQEEERLEKRRRRAAKTRSLLNEEAGIRSQTVKITINEQGGVHKTGGASGSGGQTATGSKTTREAIDQITRETYIYECDQVETAGEAVQLF